MAAGRISVNFFNDIVCFAICCSILQASVADNVDPNQSQGLR